MVNKNKLKSFFVAGVFLFTTSRLHAGHDKTFVVHEVKDSHHSGHSGHSYLPHIIGVGLTFTAIYYLITIINKDPKGTDE